MSEIEYFYSAHSAFAYLGAARLMEIARASGRKIIHRPMNLRPVVSAVSPGGFKGRSKDHLKYYFRREIERWSEYRGVPFKGGVPANHGNDMTLASCLLIAAARSKDGADQLAHAIMQSHWRDHGDLADEILLRELVEQVGLDPAPLFEAAQSDAVKAAYEKNTSEAIERAVFGSPTYFIDGDKFYGQDHLKFVERAIQKPFADNWPGK